MGSIFSFLADPKLQEGTDKATETEWNCPICRDTRDDLAYVMPCLHQFCLGCIMRWAEMQIVCPLCRELIESVRFSVQTDSYIDCVFTAPEDASSWAGTTLGQLVRNNPYHFAASPSRSPRGILPAAEPGGAGTEPVGGLLPRVWAELFRRDEHLLDPVVPWLRQELEAIYGTRWWMARIAESIILHAVSICGPVANILVQVLQDFLEEHTEPLIHGTISIIVDQCSEEAHRLLHSPALPEEDSSSVATVSSTQRGTPGPHSTPDRSSTSSSTMQAVLGSPHPSAPVPADQEELQDEAMAEEEELEEELGEEAMAEEEELGEGEELWEQEELGEEAGELGRVEENNLEGIPGIHQGGIPALHPAAGSSPVGSNLEDRLSTSEAVLHSPHPPVPVPAEQEELEQAAEADPSIQGGSRSLSSPSRDRDGDPFRRRPRRAPRRRAASFSDSPQPSKRPPHPQH
ncbi:E3 ubiquitin-protein ligase Topors-like isoform X1 [Corapipo altera]|uniref:E3 ubiquitin-protein ligase Topors-like isoform X1 n=1 Tax=Corapipo altera TaxID=415028 RepID=UPI000FD6A4EB|nr:E3 ubiquitin-protein ligase Topors-like isoform X1 [Corapipo altera]XP_027508247.1 E3 ubiquitin-protein ligase Topors-like isoform X1 [Corapipo altera]